MCVRIQGGVMDCQELGIKQILPEFQKPKSDLGFWDSGKKKPGFDPGLGLYPLTVVPTLSTILCQLGAFKSTLEAFNQHNHDFIQRVGSDLNNTRTQQYTMKRCQFFPRDSALFQWKKLAFFFFAF
ncbi:hypothetical protein CROQUDRAFT_488299 [Cronartium quercuum f. sp. fusiforme G11]|uniref:Uncharacterized protein n=1 Tax=Cronartium quercuum f. sp. fusiforme G11 TaxID=708437 RepID=A0A9P6TC83_9BASI|nr:hypothetical protein CROQUDRAFT_488299 [Cronartium quercuum f. sp. fusiforme G11]